MKSYKILLFLLAIFTLLGLGWYFFPQKGVRVGNVELRFPSYRKSAVPDTVSKLDVDSVLESIQESFVMTCSDSLLDSLHYFRDFLTKNPNRIYLPEDDYLFFDTLFGMFDAAKDKHTVYRVMHYGDSQIEMDRISSVLRQTMQDLFGGIGVGLIPVIQKTPSVSVSQKSSGALSRYVIFGDSTTQRASHSRYGVMGYFSQLSGKATVSFRESNHSYAKPSVKRFSRVSLLVGNNNEGFSATLECDTFPAVMKVCEAKEGVSLLKWEFPEAVKTGTLYLEGRAEVYGLLLDGDGGVALDNNPLRGCSGTIFTRIDEDVVSRSFDLLNTRLIILQFGGNRMPSIGSSKNISSYMRQIERQFGYFRRVAPLAKLLFVGPSDMGKRIGGKLGTWPRLPELNDSLKSTALRNGVAYWDMFNVMGGENSMVRWVQHNPPFAVSDYIHFTQHGAQEIGAVLSKSFRTYYDFYKLRQTLPNDSVLNFITRKDFSE